MYIVSNIRIELYSEKTAIQINKKVPQEMATGSINICIHIRIGLSVAIGLGFSPASRNIVAAGNAYRMVVGSEIEGENNEHRDSSTTT